MELKSLDLNALLAAMQKPESREAAEAEMERRRAKYATQIGALIANAEDERLDPSTRKAYAEKAERLMREYRVTEEEAIAKDALSIEPIWSEMILVEFGATTGGSHGMSQKYVSLWQQVAKHAGVRSTVKYRYAKETDGSDAALIARFVGFDIDVRLAEFLWISARLVFLTRIDPRVNPSLSDGENAYYMRAAGIKRNEIANKLWGSAFNDGHAHGKVQRLYLAECLKRGEAPAVMGRGVQAAIYRKAFADAFVNEFGWRLQSARDAVDKEGGAIELSGRKSKVDEAFYVENPGARPMTPEERAAYEAEDARLSAERDAEEANCARCKAAKTKCRKHRPYSWTQADERRWARRYDSAEAKAGMEAGSEAARSVTIQRTGGARTARTDPAPQRQEIG